MTSPDQLSDLWGALRSFASSGDQPVHARWRQLKNLSHVLHNHPDPEPYWDYLKTVLVQEVQAEKPAFEVGGMRLEVESVCSGSGLQWGPSSMIHPENWSEEQEWYREGREGRRSLGGDSRGLDLSVKGWNVRGELAEQALQQGIPWKVMVMVKAPRRWNRTWFEMPLATGFLSATPFTEEDRAMTRAWREALLFEEQTVWEVASSNEAARVLDELEWLREGAGIDRACLMNCTQEWINVVATGANLRRGALRLRDPGRGFYRTSRSYVEHRRFGWVHEERLQNPCQDLILAQLTEAYPETPAWEGAARSVLGSHAVRTFVEKDRRGREGLLQAVQEYEVRKAEERRIRREGIRAEIPDEHLEGMGEEEGEEGEAPVAGNVGVWGVDAAGVGADWTALTLVHYPRNEDEMARTAATAEELAAIGRGEAETLRELREQNGTLVREGGRGRQVLTVRGRGVAAARTGRRRNPPPGDGGGNP
jgi:hypothetical protein